MGVINQGVGFGVNKGIEYNTVTTIGVKTDTGIATIDDLCGARIQSVKGDTIVFRLQNKKELESVEASTVYGTCGRTLDCAGTNVYKLFLDRYLDKIEVYNDCQMSDLDMNFKKQELEEYVRAWKVAESKDWTVKATATFTPFVPTTAVNTVDIMNEMVNNMVAKGYNPSELIFAMGSQQIANYNSVGGQLSINQNTAVGLNNTFGTRGILNLGTLAPDSIYLYVHEWSMGGRNCVSLPEFWEGTNEYKGSSMLGGKEQYGIEFVQATDDLVYTPVVTP